MHTQSTTAQSFSLSGGDKHSSSTYSGMRAKKSGATSTRFLPMESLGLSEDTGDAMNDSWQSQHLLFIFVINLDTNKKKNTCQQSATSYGAIPLTKEMDRCPGFPHAHRRPFVDSAYLISVLAFALTLYHGRSMERKFGQDFIPADIVFCETKSMQSCFHLPRECAYTGRWAARCQSQRSP